MNRQSLAKATLSIILVIAFSLLTLVSAPQAAFAKGSSDTALQGLANSVDAATQQIGLKSQNNTSDKQCLGDMKMVNKNCMPVAFAPEVRSLRVRPLVPRAACNYDCVNGKRYLIGFCISCSGA